VKFGPSTSISIAELPLIAVATSLRWMWYVPPPEIPSVAVHRSAYVE